MAIDLSTVGPGKDYTSLAAWWTAKQNNENDSPPHAECYSGSDLGGLTLSAGTFTPDTSNYVHIYTADGERHNGTNVTSGAYWTAVSMTISLDYTRVEGLAFTESAQFQVWLSINANNVLFNGILAVGGGGFADLGIGVGGDKTGVVIRNCISQNFGTGFSSPGPGEVTFQNCVAYNNNNVGFTFSTSSTVTVENCVSMSNGTDFQDAGATSITANNNISSDSTADNFGGTGHFVDQVATNVFTDPANDVFTLKVGSPAINAGKTIVAVVADMLGVSRPQGGIYDIGAFETPFPEINIKDGAVSIADGETTPVSFGTAVQGS